MNGVAGTGNGYIINAICNILQTRCAITATTDKYSYNIRGITIHSLLKLPVGPRGNKDLTGESLKRLQESLSGINYVVVDEHSMFGQTTFDWIDGHFKEATSKHDQVQGSFDCLSRPVAT